MPTLALVDDDENIVTSLKMFFEAEGYQVRTYFDGQAALPALTETPPDIAILDVKMPKMDGMELLRRLRQTSDVPVIFLTSKDEEIDEVIGFNIGADDFVRKPCSNRLLSERVKAVLRRARGGTAGPEEGDHKANRSRQDDARPEPSRLHMGRQAGTPDGNRVPDPAKPRPAPGLCEKPRPAYGCGL